MALVLIKPELDQWEPAQHNGTFRGNNLAFVAATSAIKHYWMDKSFSKEVKEKGKKIEACFNRIASRFPDADIEVRGRGFVWGIESKTFPETASEVIEACFKDNLIVENCGSAGQTLKFLGALTITDNELEEGLSIIEKHYDAILTDKTK
jgi:diaminobutyrate-2-oxoglutarate transaminase